MARRPRILYVHACVALLACGSSETQGPSRTSRPAIADVAASDTATSQGEPDIVEVSLDEVGLESASMDRSADPCTDFFQYACGGWLKATEIPDDRARYSRFTEVAERNEEALRQILDQARRDTGPDPVTRTLGRFYSACMDEAAIEKAGLGGIEPLLAAARRLEREGDMSAAIAELHRHGIWAVFSASPEPDFKDSSRNLLFLDSAGLSLPDRAYYIEGRASFVKVRTFYRGHVQRMFQLAGMARDAARRAAMDVVELETALARATRTQTERRDPARLYNKVDRKGLIELAPTFAWDAYLSALGRPELHDIVVTTPAYKARFEELLASVKRRQWSHYLQWQVLHHMAPSLPKKFVDENFALARILTDQPRIQPRWKRCIDATGEALGELLGQRYVAERFAGESKRAAATMVGELRAAFAAELASLPWMAPATRDKALAKLSAMNALIGHPELWKEYDFPIDIRDYAGAVLAARAFETRRQIGKAGQPFDRSEWLVTPQTVNAYYSPLANQIVFPAGILQIPFFAARRGVAANLGAIGMVVGHELTHGFDDSGARFDAAGNMTNWWQDADAREFEAKGRCLVEQYSAYEPLPGLKLNGALTLRENIADLGGTKLAFRAYRKLRKSAGERYVAEGLSEDQQFFVAAGQAWCTKARDAEVRRRVVVDSHAPPRFRVNGVMRNTPEFAEAFGCEKGAPMRPEDICEVW
jgi:putative endopeptidase